MENKSAAPVAQVLVPAVSEIRSLLEASRKNVAQQVNQELLSTYWKIGEVVVRCEQNDSIRAAYGEKTLSQLSRALTKELGKGFARKALDKGAWQGLFALECLQYAAVLSQLSNFPDSVWKIELVALL